MITIYHNPRCSKSREALAMIEQFAARSGETVNIVEYLRTPPAQSQLTDLQRQLGVDVREMVRSNEEEYEGLGLARADDATLLRALAEHPKLLQRPIVVYRERAVIARPPELLNALLV